MKSESNKPFLILNASAGSGKTFNLVRNYLRLLLSEGENRSEMSQIIAMTFTNKAALEMKTRIVSDLNKLSNAPNDLPFLVETAAYIGLSTEKVQKNARLTLKKILHQYEDFNVLTIDKFNLRLIRSFSRDLNLPEQFEVVLDEDLILEKAVDELLNTIDKNEQNSLYQLAINYAKSNFDEENKWNVKKALLASAAILKNEQSFATIRKLTASSFTENDLKAWKETVKLLKMQLQQLLRNVSEALQTSGLSPEDFSNKSKTYNTLLKFISTKLKTDELITNLELTPSFIGHIEKTGELKGQSELVNALITAHDFWLNNKEQLLILELKIKQFYLLSILKELALSMEQIRQKESVIRISEFNQLVADLVKDEEAPFIYERLGTRFGHFFLDEFQDTSRLQWSNLVPLVHESLGNNQFNFIVGDPKQSIYRFKNGVAEQFVALPRIYNPENDAKTASKSDFFEAQGQVSGLEENWRSAQEIVTFNNEFFTGLKTLLPESGQSYYNKIKQAPRGKADGLITFKMDHQKDKTQKEDELALLEKWVNECIADGYEPGDICILSKNKRSCNSFANHLKTKGFSVISSDSLLVDSDVFVQLVVSFLKWRSNPLENQYAMQFAEKHFRIRNEDDNYKLYEECFETVEIEGQLKKRFSIPTFISISGFDESLLNTGYQSIYSLIQTFIRTNQIDELHNAYIHQLLDISFNFDLSNGPDLMSFLSYYATTGHKSNVQLPDNKHAIKIMTAHKSKGLEFPIVLIPLLNFGSTRNENAPRIIENEGHFIETKLVQKDYFLPEIEELGLIEKEAKLMDAINLLYVAFTRPIDRLYFYSNSGHSDTNKKVLATLSALYPELIIDNEHIQGVIGNKPQRTIAESTSDSSFTATSLSDFLWFPEISLFSQEEAEATALNKQQRIGNLFHGIMENSSTKEEAMTFLATGIRKGKIEKSAEKELLSLIEEIYSNEQIQALFSIGTHLNERTLAIDPTTLLRPDKIIYTADQTVVIDFKTGDEQPKYIKQVNDYVRALNDVGFNNVSGYLYYVGGKGLIPIETGLF